MLATALSEYVILNIQPYVLRTIKHFPKINEPENEN
jgi:hypothetical protein